MDILTAANSRTAIWGAAREGLAVARKISQINPQAEILIFNDQELSAEQTQDFKNLNVKFFIGDQIKGQLDSIEVLIKSPGVSFYRPEIQQLIEKGIKVTSGTDLWLAAHKHKKVLAITGSKGKSTTTSICTEILKAEGLDAICGGNIGKPLWDLSEQHEFYVLELSSYQITDLSEKIDAAALLNLYPAHQLWHGSEERYYQDKTKIQNLSSKLIVNAQDPKIKKYLTKKDIIFYNEPNTFLLRDEIIYKNNEYWFDCSQMKIMGAHNYLNTCAALTLAAQFCEITDKSKQALTSFQAISHRLEKAGCFNGINFINDSISTVPEATIAAIKAVKSNNLTLLIGGQDIEGNWSEFYTFLANHPIQQIVSLPDNGSKIVNGFLNYLHINNLQSTINFTTAQDLSEAVKISKAITPSGGTVLLSPGTPSYGRFKNFEERGNLFKSLARESI